MQLVILDKDSNYVHQLEKMICTFYTQHSMQMEFIIIHSLEELKSLEISRKMSKERGMFVFNEEFIPDFFEKPSEMISYYLINQQWCILSEGIWENRWEHIIHSFCTEQECSMDSVAHRIIHKYQSVTEIYHQLKNCFIDCIDREIVAKKIKTSFITVYKPYGEYSFSEVVLKQMKTLHFSLKDKKILIIQYDSFFHDEKNTKNNLSYVYMQIRNRKTNLGFILNEIVQRPCRNIDLLEGALNMKDYDFLSEEEENSWLAWLREKSGYDIVIFNMNGVHITRALHTIILQSERTFLYSEEEVIQRSVLEQINAKWHITENNDISILKGSIEKLLKGQEV